MSDSAHVESIDAIAHLRGRVIETSEAVNREIDGALSQVKRVLAWVQGPQLDYWKQQVRKREQKIATAMSDLERAKIARPDADPRTFVDQQRAVRRARQAVEEAKEKIRKVKYWSRELERHAMKFRGELQATATFGSATLPQTARWMAELIRHLEGYVSDAPAMAEYVEDAGDVTSGPMRRAGAPSPDEACDDTDEAEA